MAARQLCVIPRHDRIAMNSRLRLMPLLIHAQVTVAGKPEALAPFRDEVKRVLSRLAG